jgi:hypothetical protein
VEKGIIHKAQRTKNAIGNVCDGVLRLGFSEFQYNVDHRYESIEAYPRPPYPLFNFVMIKVGYDNG